MPLLGPALHRSLFDRSDLMSFREQWNIRSGLNGQVRTDTISEWNRNLN